MPNKLQQARTWGPLKIICAVWACCALAGLSPVTTRAQESPIPPDTASITSLGAGPSEVPVAPGSDAESTFTAVDDARKRSIVLFLIETLGITEYDRLEKGIDSLILTDYERYIIDSTLLTEERIPLSDDVIVSMRVTLDAASLLSYAENIARLAPPPEDQGGPTEDEMMSHAARAEELFLQADVASDVLLNPLSGIESYTDAMELFEAARDDEGVYRCLMGIGGARASLGYLEEAADAFDRAEDIARSLGNNRDAEAARLERARLRLFAGEYVGASEEILDILQDIRGAGYDDIEARAREFLSRADFALDRRDAALDGAVLAISLYELLGDRKSHYTAYLTYGLMLLSAGEIENAIETLKLAKIMSEKMENSERRILALTALGSAYVAIGDVDGARLYLDEAVTTAENAGWEYGAARALIERAKLSLTAGSPSRAVGDAARAEEMARNLDAPAVSAAALFVRGRIAELQGDRAGALDFYLEAVEEASDIRISGVREPYAPFTTDDMKACVEAICGIAAEMNDPKSAAEAISRYHGALTARYLFVETPDDFSLPTREPVSVAEWKAAVGRTLGVEAVRWSPVANALSDASRAALDTRREDTLDAFFDIAASIKRQAPILALISGIDRPDYPALKFLLGASGAHVQYFVGPSRTFALVVTMNDLDIVSLPTGSSAVIEAVDDLREVMEGTAAPVSGIPPEQVPEAPVNTDEESSESDEANTPAVLPEILTVDEAARRAAALLFSPVSSRLAGKSAVGVNPGPELSGLPLAALADSTGFLPEHAAVFHCPALLRRYFTQEASPPTLTYLMTLGRGRIDVTGSADIFYDTYLIDSLEGGLTLLPDEARLSGDFALVLNDVSGTPVVSHPAALTLFASPPGDDSASLFCALELFFAGGPESGGIILPGADPDDTGAFFRKLVLGVREYGMPKGFLSAVTAGGEGQAAPSTHYLLFGDF